LHPEFGYLGIPTFGRTLIMLALCGLVAGVAGVNVFKAGREPIPQVQWRLRRLRLSKGGH
jgi:hypothetical protein